MLPIVYPQPLYGMVSTMTHMWPRAQVNVIALDRGSSPSWEGVLGVITPVGISMLASSTGGCSQEIHVSIEKLHTKIFSISS